MRRRENTRILQHQQPQGLQRSVHISGQKPVLSRPTLIWTKSGMSLHLCGYYVPAAAHPMSTPKASAQGPRGTIQRPLSLKIVAIPRGSPRPPSSAGKHCKRHHSGQNPDLAVLLIRISGRSGPDFIELVIRSGIQDKN